MKPALESESSQSQSHAVNPYQAPHHASSSKAPLLSLERRDFSYWRAYLLLHLVVVVITFIATCLDTGYWNAAWLRQSGAGSVVFFAVFPGMLLLYVSPIIVLTLVIRSFKYELRYALAATSECLLAGAHLFVALPLVQ